MNDLMQELYEAAEEDFVPFQTKILCTQKKILGIRTPVLRRIAAARKGRYDEYGDLPDDIYEACFVRLCLAETLPYERLLKELPRLIGCMDCWALTDTFKPKAIAKNKRTYAVEIEKQIADGREFFVRFALVTLLWSYREKEDLPFVFDCAVKADNEKYYIHMATAWLIAEALVRHYEEAVCFLKKQLLPVKTHNKAIQKARESYRISAEQKEYLKKLKRY